MSNICSVHPSRIVADGTLLEFQGFILGLWDVSTDNKNKKFNETRINYLTETLKRLSGGDYYPSRESVRILYKYEFDFARAEDILTRLTGGDFLEDRIFRDFYKLVPRFLPRSSL